MFASCGAPSYPNLPLTPKSSWKEHYFVKRLHKGDGFPSCDGQENSCPWEETTCRATALGGHLEVLQWAAQASSSAGKGGHLEVLKWLRENGCPWDVSTLDPAAKRGYLEIMQLARANGCPWDEGV